jgi:hypothetical protein
MSIKELLIKAKMKLGIKSKIYKDLDLDYFDENIELPNNQVLFDSSIISNLDFEEFSKKFDEVSSWIQTHKQDKDNKNLDINGREFNEELWNQHNELYSLLKVELFTRPLYEKLRETKSN